MDVCKSEKQALVGTSRLPLGPAERNHNASNTTTTTHRSRTREVSSRYRSPGHATSRRSPSPDMSRTSLDCSQLVPRRANSTERKRSSSPSGPTSPRVRDSSIDAPLTRRLSTGSRLPESLWPSTMRSLNVSFQSDTISIPVSKKEKPPPTVSILSSDCISKTSSTITKKQLESPISSRKSTPERKRSPQKGKNVQHQVENCKPVDSLHSRLIDQHRWPSRTGGKLLSPSLVRSWDLSDRTGHGAYVSSSASMSSRPRISVSERMYAPAHGDSSKLLLEEYGTRGLRSSYGDGNLPHEIQKHMLTSSFGRTTSLSASKIFPVPSGSRSPSPSSSRGPSPARTRSTTTPSRGASPSRVSVSGVPSQSNSSSVLHFIVDIRKGKKGSNFIEEAHHLRLLYNRYLQWRFSNARGEAVLQSRKLVAEKTLFNVWKSTTELWSSVIKKRIFLQRLDLEIKLTAILDNQIGFLDKWTDLEEDHVNSVSRAAHDLQASVIRLPVTEGATVDMETLTDVICSAVGIMQSIASSLSFLLSKLDNINVLVSDLAALTSVERSMLDECETLFSSVTTMLIKEYSSRTHLIQLGDNQSSLPVEYV